MWLKNHPNDLACMLRFEYENIQIVSGHISSLQPKLQQYLAIKCYLFCNMLPTMQTEQSDNSKVNIVRNFGVDAHDKYTAKIHTWRLSDWSYISQPYCPIVRYTEKLRMYENFQSSIQLFKMANNPTMLCF